MLKKTSVQLIKNFSSLISIKGMDFIIPLIIFPYLIKNIGISNFGLLSFSLSLSLYFGAVIHYGFSITAVRDIARVKDDYKLLSEKFNIFIFTSICLFLISLFIFLISIKFIPILNKDFYLHLTTFFLIGMQSFFPSWFFQGIEDMKFIAYLNIGAKILYLLALFLFIDEPNDYIYVHVYYGLSIAISTITSFFLIKYKYKINFRLPEISEVLAVLKEGRHAFLSQFAPNLYNNTATFVLGITVSNSVLGFYASSTKIIDAFNSIGILLSNTFLPSLSLDIKNHKFFKKLMLLTGGGLFLFSFLFSDLIVSIFIKEDAGIVSRYFKFLTPMIFFIFLRFTYGINYLMLIGKENLYKNIVLLICLLFFGLTFVLIPSLNVYGSIIIMLGASGTMALVTYIYYLKYK